jgi:hypothetical protein
MVTLFQVLSLLVPLYPNYGFSVATPDELDLATARNLIASLEIELASARAELARVRDELRRARRDHHETPPHYL